MNLPGIGTDSTHARKCRLYFPLIGSLIRRPVDSISPMRTVKFLVLVASLLPVAAVPTGVEPLLEQLRLDHDAWVTAERDFHVRRASGALVGAEASDYAAYVARLQRRVAEDCAALAGAGTPVPAAMPCPRIESAAVTRSAAIDQAVEQTREEHIAGLDAELTAGLAEFDELLLREQERVKAATPRSASGGGTDSGNGAGVGGNAVDGSGGDGKNVADISRAAGETGAKGSPATTVGIDSQAGGPTDQTSAGAGGGTVKSPPRGASRQPPGIPDGSNDDVVARQLREAAEKETDPELQKKLWEEYRKYKQGTR
jgi:hypothetical protein